jgi:hypothetical protein
MNLQDLVDGFAEKYGVLFRPASPTEIAAAERAGVPEELLEFYREFEPNEVGQGMIRFYPLEQVVAHMTDYMPACELSRYGYFAFADTQYGDSYFVRPVEGISFHQTPIFLFSHEADFSLLSSAQVEEFSTVVASGITDFIARALAERLPTDPYEA